MSYNAWRALPRILLCAMAIWCVMVAQQHDTRTAEARPLMHHENEIIRVTIQGKVPSSHVDESFVCATLDWWPPQKCDYGQCPWHEASLLNLDLSSPILHNAINAFSPLKLRLGGSLQDRVVYDIGETVKACNPFSVDGKRLFGFAGGCLPMQRWDELNSFFQTVGSEVVFGLNALYGRAGPKSLLGPWNPSNARNFIKYTHDRGYKISAWEFGNELSGSGIGTKITATQYAADVKELHKIIDDVYGDGTLPRPLLVAPDGFFDEQWTLEFFQASDKDATIDVLTTHIYSLGAGVDHNLMEKILNPFYLDREVLKFQTIRQTLQQHAPSVNAWVGEAGGAYNSGHHLVTDAFISGFWYLDQMGMAASYGTTSYCRQSLVGGSYGLLNTTTFIPNPDYYGALLWHRLMGRSVLQTKATGSPFLRAYAHCTRDTEGVTLLLLNLSPGRTYEVDVSIEDVVTKAPSLESVARLEYHLTPKGGELTSQTVLLNGVPLQVSQHGEIPSLSPQVVKNHEPLLVSPLSIAFVSLPFLQISACMMA